MLFIQENGVKVYGVPNAGCGLTGSFSIIRLKETTHRILAWLKDGRVASFPKWVWNQMVEYWDDSQIIYRISGRR